MTAGDKPEEGGMRQIIMPLMTWATHVLQWTEQGQRNREVANPTNLFSGSDRSLQLDCEAGIASNRGSACRGEYVPGPCTHRPSHREFVTPEVGEVTF